MTPVAIGAVVYYRDETGAHFGRLVESGYKWARVRHGDTVRRVPVADLRPWPPAKVDTSAQSVQRRRA